MPIDNSTAGTSRVARGAVSGRATGKAVFLSVATIQREVELPEARHFAFYPTNSTYCGGAKFSERSAKSLKAGEREGGAMRLNSDTVAT